MSNTDKQSPEFGKSRLYEFDGNQLGRLKRLIVVGDLHGDNNTLSSLLRVVNLTEDGIVFLGDYTDRGPSGIEVIDTVNSLIKKYPNAVALKGNHEDYSEDGIPQFDPCTLIGEAEKKRENWRRYFQKELEPFIKKLYLAAIIPGEFLFVHGGISSKIRSLDDLKYPTRDVEVDILWSDPADYTHFKGKKEYPNIRGAGVEFGEDVTREVCERINVKRIVRSHQPQKAFLGPAYSHNRMVVTTSSTTVYDGRPFILIIDPTNPSSLSPYFL